MNEISTLYSIGHGHKTKEVFLKELRSFDIQFVVDVRSSPFSKWAEDFNQGVIEEWLRSANIRYVYMGDSIGGRPKDASCYDDEGLADYRLMANEFKFQKGLNRLVDANRKHCRVAIMCSESDPSECHRSKLIGRELYFSHNISVNHIIGENKISSQEEIMEKLTKNGWERPGSSIFDFGDSGLPPAPPPYFKSRKANTNIEPTFNDTHDKNIYNRSL